MAWDLAWWGNSADGNEVGLILPSSFTPFHDTPSDNVGLRGLAFHRRRFSICLLQHQAIPQLGVDSSRGQHNCMRLQYLR